jgi:LysR family transcriptional regulator, chromosome initiation inhibitor
MSLECLESQHLCESEIQVRETQHARTRKPRYMSTYDSIALECLASVVEEGSFERAAKKQFISQSAVSQRISALEAQVGQPLVLRSRPIQPTSAGQLLLKHAKLLRLLRSDLGRDLRQLSTSNTASIGHQDHISIAVDADSMATWMRPALASIKNKDHLLEFFTDDLFQAGNQLHEGKVHGCVTAMEEPPLRCRTELLGAWEYVAVAAPEFVARHLTEGLGLRRLQRLPFVAFNRRDDLPMRFMSEILGLPQLRLNQVFIPNYQGRLDAVLEGWGVGIFPKKLINAQLEKHLLIDVVPNYAMPVPMYWHCWNFESEVLDNFSYAIRTTAAQWLLPASKFPMKEHPRVTSSLKDPCVLPIGQI